MPYSGVFYSVIHRQNDGRIFHAWWHKFCIYAILFRKRSAENHGDEIHIRTTEQH